VVAGLSTDREMAEQTPWPPIERLWCCSRRLACRHTERRDRNLRLAFLYRPVLATSGLCAERHARGTVLHDCDGPAVDLSKKQPGSSEKPGQPIGD
jgi:hypothetical protein